MRQERRNLTVFIAVSLVMFGAAALAQFPNLGVVSSISSADFIPVDQAVPTSVSKNGRQTNQVPIGTLAASTMFAGSDEIVAITGANTFAPLAHTPVGTVELWINGKKETSVGVSPAFSVSGAQMSWNAANAGYSISTANVAEARYPY